MAPWHGLRTSEIARGIAQHLARPRRLSLVSSHAIIIHFMCIVLLFSSFKTSFLLLSIAFCLSQDISEIAGGIAQHLARPRRYRCQWTKLSFCESLCLATQQQKLLYSPWLRIFQAYHPKGFNSIIDIDTNYSFLQKPWTITWTKQQHKQLSTLTVQNNICLCCLSYLLISFEMT